MIVRRSAIVAALAAVSDDNSRYFLNGIQLEPDANAVIATDGNMLLRVTDHAPLEDGDFPAIPGAEFHGNPSGPVVLPADICKAMIAAMPKKPTIPILGSCQVGRNGSDTTITVSATDLQAPRTATVDQADRTFPQYRRVMPADDRPEIAVSLAVDILESLIKAAKAVNSGSKRTPTIKFGLPLGKQHRDKITIPGRPAADGFDATEDRTVAGDVIGGVRVTINGLDGFTVDGVAMPCRVTK